MLKVVIEVIDLRPIPLTRDCFSTRFRVGASDCVRSPLALFLPRHVQDVAKIITCRMRLKFNCFSIVEKRFIARSTQ